MLPCHVDMIVMAACVLHNYLLNPRDRELIEGQRDGEHSLQSVRHMGGNRGPREALQTRELLTARCNLESTNENILECR